MRGVPRHHAKVSISMQQDQDQQDGRTEVIMEPMMVSPPEPLAGEEHLLSGQPVLVAPLQIGRRGIPSHLIFGERTKASINRTSHHHRKGTDH